MAYSGSCGSWRFRVIREVAQTSVFDQATPNYPTNQLQDIKFNLFD